MKRNEKSPTWQSDSEENQTTLAKNMMAQPASKEKQQVSTFPEGAIAGDRPVRIEPGEYELAFQFHRTLFLFGRAPKLCCFFKIVTLGKYFEVIVPRYYNVQSLAGKPRKGGAFKVGWHSDFVREYATIFGLPLRPNRISTEIFKTAIVRGRVDTVSTNSRQRSIPESLRYSVITELMERVQ